MRSLVVGDHGQIERLNLPKGWCEAADKPRSDMDIATLKKFHPEDCPDAQLCFYYRGMPMNESPSQKFHDLLQQPPHQLSAAEIRNVEGALETLGNEHLFDMLNARTEDLNGKRILIVEGRWNQLGYDTIHLLLDADGTGAQVQEIYFAAPKNEYLRYIAAARAAIQSIEWKPAPEVASAVNSPDAKA